MKLSINSDICDNCRRCLAKCPNNLSSLDAVLCRHCNPAKAKCAEVCEKNCIYAIAEGVLSIDAELCDGCGKCTEACKYRAIEIANGKAKKCDLCANNNFFISCLKECHNNAISIIKSQKEVQETERMLGWRIFKIDDSGKLKVKKEVGDYKIIENRDNEKTYYIKQFPELTKQETALIKEVVEEFREQNNNGKLKGLIERTLDNYCKRNFIALDEEQRDYLLKIINSVVFEFGPISKLLSDDNIEEIAIIGLGKDKPVYVYERQFGWLRTNIYFSDETTVINTINKMSRSIGRRLTLQTPKLNAVLNDGNRLNACISPVSFLGPAATIRKFRQVSFTPADLVENLTISAEATAFLWMTLQTDCSLIISGNTGSGKTSTLNALFSFVPKEERIVITEETPEINLPHKHLVKLSVVPDLEIGMQSLIVDSLRMRPDRIIVGEVRSREEVAAFMDTLLAGQGKGSYATFHALSAEETLTRMKSLGISELDLSSIDLVLVQKRWNKIDLKKGVRKELRKVVEIGEVINEGGNVKINHLFGFNYSKDSLEKIGKSEKVMEKMLRTFNMDREGIEREIKSRKKVIEKLMKKRRGIEDFFDFVNSGKYG